MLTFYQMVWIFAIYAFIGWCVEVIYATACDGKFVNRGFLNGPICPIYGFGVLFVYICLNPIKENIFLLFLGSMALTTVLEFLTGFVMEKFFDDKWWDYSKEPFNIKGYICLKASLIWGVSCVFVLNIIQPIVMNFISFFPKFFGITFLIIAFLVILADGIVTVTATIHMKQKLRILNDISVKLKTLSDSLGSSLSDETLDVKEKLEERKKEFDELKLKEKALALRENFVQKRLIKSFPHLASGKYKEAIDTIKKHLSDISK